MISTKGGLYEYMREHPELVLQYCVGIRSKGWWWLRDKGGRGSYTIRVHARAAKGLRDNKLVRALPETDWTRREYVLAAGLRCAAAADDRGGGVREGG